MTSLMRAAGPKVPGPVGTFESVDASAPPPWRLPLALVCVALVMVLAIRLWVGDLAGRRLVDDLPRLELPAVANLDIATARARLEVLGVIVDITPEPNETVPKGTAFGQEPPAGAKVQQGDLVKILVSDGPAGVSVPAIVGQQVADAEAALAADLINATVVQVYDDTIRAGEVMSTDPPPGGRIATQGTVTLTVSQGPPPRTVPDLVGKDLNSSLVALGRNGLGIGTITRVYKADQPAGTVLTLDPGSSSQVPRDTPIKITVTGPPPMATVPSMTGLLQSSATQVAKTAGLTLNVVTQGVPPGDPRIGRVLSQGVPPFSQLSSGATVQVVVGSLDPGATPTSPVGPGN